MNFGADAPLPPFIKTDAEVIERVAIYKEPFALGTENRDKLRRELHHLVQLCFLSSDLFFGSHQSNVFLAKAVFSLLTILDISARAVPPDDPTGFVAERLNANEKPSVSSVKAANTRLDFTWFSGDQQLLPLFH